MKTQKTHIKHISLIKNFFLFVTMLFLFNNCVEEIEFNDSDFNKLLVVKASLNDEFKKHRVELSRINALNSDEDTFETKAIVTIIENSQKTYSFTELPNGIYESKLPFKASLGNQYSLHIKTLDGEMYKSIPEEIQGINNIDKINAKPDTDTFGAEGLTISVESKSTNNDAKYYKYTYSETYKIIAPYFSTKGLKIISDVYPWKVEEYIHNEKREVCYNTIESINLIQTETNSLSENVAVLPILFIKKEDFKIAHRYSLEVKQHVQSYEAYTYFKTLNKLSNEENVFSQSQQGFLQGNIIPTKNQGNKVVGFFEVNSTSKKRIFFNLNEIFPDHFINTRELCKVFAPALTTFSFIDRVPIPDTDFSPLIDALKNGYLYTDKASFGGIDMPGPYTIVKKECGDCRVNGTNIKPNFWID